MAEYEALVNQADELRTRGNQKSDTYEAMRLYADLADTDQSLPREARVHCWQQAGVCAIQLRRHGEAHHFLDRASVDANDVELANILRDEGKLLMQEERFNEAEAALLESYEILDGRFEQGQAKAMTMDFLGRLSDARGNYVQALVRFNAAEDMLKHGDPKLRLYNKLNVASARSKIGTMITFRLDAIEALRLAIRHGGRPHQLRALALLIGGHRLESYARKLWH